MRYKPEITRGNENQKRETLNGKMGQGDTGTKRQQTNRQRERGRQDLNTQWLIY